MKGYWGIKNNQTGTTPPRLIVHSEFDSDMLLETYNYIRFTPVCLAPIGKTSTLVLSEHREEDNKLELMIHDLRVVDTAIVGSIAFNLRGDAFHMETFKSEMNRICDTNRCVGISYFLRKLFYTGFSTIYVPKKIGVRNNGNIKLVSQMILSEVHNNIQPRSLDSNV